MFVQPSQRLLCEKQVMNMLLTSIMRSKWLNTGRFFSFVIVDWDEVEVHKNAKSDQFPASRLREQIKVVNILSM